MKIGPHTSSEDCRCYACRITALEAELAVAIHRTEEDGESIKEIEAASDKLEATNAKLRDEVERLTKAINGALQSMTFDRALNILRDVTRLTAAALKEATDE